MSKVDLQKMTPSQLKKYLYEHKNDDEKFSAALGELMSRNIWTQVNASTPLSKQEEILKRAIENITNVEINAVVKSESPENTYHQSGNFGIGHISDSEIEKGAKVAAIINEAEQQNLAEAAAEIQQLLEQLSQTYPTSTNKERMAVVAEAVDRIESDLTLKARVINALKAGGTEAFKEAINHPLVNILMAAFEGWQEAE